MEGPEDVGGEGILGREEKIAKRAESNFAPPQLGEPSTRESESVKERVNGLFFRFGGRSYLSVSFSILTTAEEPKSLKCIWNKTCIYFHSNKIWLQNTNHTETMRHY